ncbi:MAG: hypothetical protein U1C33_02500, partial [Candidatus Cloacimonadaceae bacterium]|nr:hypothetical protein [Candidatus Cloacimonadaceae bacterium]
MKKKIVWICHFTDNEIQSIIKPYIQMKESALWISMLLKVFENRDDIDLHIISPHQYITGVKSFTRRGIKFYFFNAFMPVIGRHWPNFFRWDLWTD